MTKLAIETDPADAGFDPGRLRRFDAYLNRLVDDGTLAGTIAKGRDGPPWASLAVWVTTAPTVFGPRSWFVRRSPARSSSRALVRGPARPGERDTAPAASRETEVRLSSNLGDREPGSARNGVTGATSQSPSA